MHCDSRGRKDNSAAWSSPDGPADSQAPAGETEQPTEVEASTPIGVAAIALEVGYAA